MSFFTEINTVKAGLVFILILIIGIGVASYRNIDEVFKTAEWRANSYNVLNTTEDILTQIVSAEEGQRSYLITEDESYLDLYKKSYNNVKLDLSNLKMLLKDNKSQSERLIQFDTLISYRFNSLQVTIDIVKKGDLKRAAEIIKNKVGRNYMQRIYEMTAKIEANEYNLLQARDQLLIINVKNTFVTIIIGTLVSCIIFLTVFYILDREINERKKVEVAIRREMEFSDRLLNSSIDGIVAFDSECRYTLWNPGMETMTGINKSKALGKSAFEVLPFLKEIGEDKYFYETLKGNYVIAKDRWFSIPETGKEGYFEAYYSPILDFNKNVVGGISILRDSTQRKFGFEALERTKEELERRVIERTSALSKVNEDLRKEILERKKAEEQISNSLQEKVVLLREIHHRVKNNLQVISSLLNLQSSYIEDKKALEIFRESQNRIRSMALIHEKLYQSKDLNKIEFSEYVKSLIKDLFSSYNVDTERIILKSEFEGIYFEIDIAILCGLIINELVSNSLKHAFPSGRKGEIYIELKNEEKKYILILRDTGIGFPAGLDFRKTESLGLQLVNTLTDQLGGKIELNQNGCTEFKIVFEV
ncbi:MAG: CHASE3 domain-containing protein [Bacteroidetes bacterium]|nr:CHASE3 domain-containing protein [Bacteroidota bacterium]